MGLVWGGAQELTAVDWTVLSRAGKLCRPCLAPLNAWKQGA